MENKVDQAVILMGGLGTRFLPATKIIAKEMFPIGNKPAVMYHLEELYQSGIKNVYIIISKKKKNVAKFFKRDKKLEKSLKNLHREHMLDEYNEILNKMTIKIIIQGKLNGSGGAIYYAKKYTNGRPFALILGDDLCKTEKGKLPAIGQLCKAYEKTGKNVIGVKPFPIEVVPRYSSVVIGKKLSSKSNEVLDIIEKPKNPPTNLVGLARYVLTSDIFDEILKCPKFENGELRFTDALTALSKQGKVVSCEFDARYYDCGNKLEYTKCLIDFALEDKEIKAKLKEFLKERSE